MALSAIRWLLTLLLIVVETTADQQCFPQRTSGFKFRLKSYSNETGLRFFTVGLESEARSEDQVILDVNHWTGSCGGAETVGVQVGVTTPTYPPTEGVFQNTSASSTMITAEVPQATPCPSIPMPTPAVPTPAVPTKKPVADCWPGYELLPGVACYKEVKEYMTWQQALISCLAQGAHLAAPESQEQLNFFREIAMREGHNPWLGIRKTGGKWISVQGSVISLNSRLWSPGKPSGRGDCAYVKWTEGLTDWECDDTGRSICRQP